MNLEGVVKGLVRNWSGKRDSNSRPRPWQGRALPTELFPLKEDNYRSLQGFGNPNRADNAVLPDCLPDPALRKAAIVMSSCLESSS